MVKRAIQAINCKWLVKVYWSNVKCSQYKTNWKNRISIRIKHIVVDTNQQVSDVFICTQLFYSSSGPCTFAFLTLLISFCTLVLYWSRVWLALYIATHAHDYGVGYWDLYDKPPPYTNSPTYTRTLLYSNSSTYTRMLKHSLKVTEITE